MKAQPHPASLTIEELRKECAVERVRRSGPGGQHRNKVETGVVIRHEPTGFQAEANERRSQAENLAMAWQRLRVRLALEVRQGIASEPSELWRSRVVGSGISVNEGHEDFPALLAEAFNVLEAVEWDDAQAASFLGISRSQFAKFLQKEPKAFTVLNAKRVSHGKKPLK